MQLEAVQLVVRADGRLTGEAFITFASAEDARTAQRTKDRAPLGTRYIEVFLSTAEECARLTAHSSSTSAATGPGATAAGNGESSSVATSSSASSEVNDAAVDKDGTHATAEGGSVPVANT